MVTPEIALEPDIKGVCKVAGIFVISSNPSNKDKTNIKLVRIISMLHLYISGFNNMFVC